MPPWLPPNELKSTALTKGCAAETAGFDDLPGSVSQGLNAFRLKYLEPTSIRVRLASLTEYPMRHAHHGVQPPGSDPTPST